MPVVFDEPSETLPEDLPDMAGESKRKRSRNGNGKHTFEPAKVEPKPAMQVAPTPAGARTDYGGCSAWIGARVWYCLEDEFEPGTLRVLPADLMSRNYTDPSAWEIVVYEPDASNFPADAVSFSEVPKEGCWCWPVIPKVD